MRSKWRQVADKSELSNHGLELSLPSKQGGWGWKWGFNGRSVYVTVHHPHDNPRASRESMCLHRSPPNILPKKTEGKTKHKPGMLFFTINQLPGCLPQPRIITQFEGTPASQWFSRSLSCQFFYHLIFKYEPAIQVFQTLEENLPHEKERQIKINLLVPSFHETWCLFYFTCYELWAHLQVRLQIPRE